jgi:flavin-dependent dehydrogenase
MTHAVVLGGGMAGILSAVALAPHVDDVTVVESDVLPGSPGPRRGLPQAQQNHMLMGGGAQAIDALLPGTTALLYAAGAHPLNMGTRLLTLSAEGWARCFPGAAYAITCSRHLVDHIVRQQALAGGTIKVVESAKAVGLAGDASRVTGVRVERRAGGQTIGADLVVDATGSRSQAPRWLGELGLPPVKEEFLDAGLTYVGRWHEAPPGVAADFPGVLIQPEPGTGRPGYGAALMPNENGRWIITMMGTRGGHPPSSYDGFVDFARRMRHPIVAELIATARPVGDTRSSHGLGNRRRYYERLPVPEGFLAIGDAVTVLSPNYATGMSIAALSALALRKALDGTELTPALARKMQKKIARIGAASWQMALGQDRWFPGVESNIRLRGGTMQRRFAARWARTAAGNASVADATSRVATLLARPPEMMTPGLMLSVLRGPRRPPLTADEAIAQFPAVEALLQAFEAVPSADVAGMRM